MKWMASIGQSALAYGERHRRTAALAAQIAVLALRPSAWSRPVRNVLARQILFTGVDAMSFVTLVALLVGLTVVLQAQVWLSNMGQSAVVGPLLVAIVIREVGPLLVNFILIGRSGTAIAAELASMRVAGELRVLEAQGIDPLHYLLLPRGLGVALSSFCLAILFVAGALVSGYVSGLLLGLEVGPPDLFFLGVMRAIAPADVVNLAAKTLLSGLLTGIICSVEGLGVKGALTEVPQAATRGVVRAVAAMFLTSILISLLTYL